MSADRPSVLIIDDDPDFLDLYTIQLDRGFEVFVASDGEEGIRKLLELEPSVVLLDLRMPKVSGKQVLEYMQARSGLQDTPVIVVTARHVGEDLRALCSAMKNVVQVYEKTVSPRTVAEQTLRAARIGTLYRETEGLARRGRAEDLSRPAGERSPRRLPTARAPTRAAGSGPASGRTRR
jgi:DNA-binding response OmpR family regulator